MRETNRFVYLLLFYWKHFILIHSPTRYKRYFLAHRCVINQCKYCFRTIAESDALNFARFTHTRFCNETLRHTSGISNAKSTSFSHNPTCWRKSVFGFRPLCFIIQFAVGNDVYSGGGLWFLCVVFRHSATQIVWSSCAFRGQTT